MGKFLILLGVVLLLGGVALSYTFFSTSVLAVSDFPQIGSGFDDTLPIPPAEINAAITEANRIASAVNDAAISQKSLAQKLLLAVVIFGALTTIVAGIQKVKKWNAVLSTVFTVLLAILGTLSAISTSTAGYLNGVGDKRFACVDTIEMETAETIAAVRVEISADAARQYLVELTRTAQRCQI